MMMIASVEKKDEWKSDKGNVGNKTKTFPQLHHFPFSPYQDEDGHGDDRDDEDAHGEDVNDDDDDILFPTTPSCLDTLFSFSCFPYGDPSKFSKTG